MIWKFVEVGMNVVWFNMFYGDYVLYKEVIDFVWEFNKEVYVNVIVFMLDIKVCVVFDGILCFV